MGLFKSKDERRIERDLKLKAAFRAIERSIQQQQKFSEEFVKNAQHARRIGDQQQYQFIRNALKRTANLKRMLERQLLTMKSASLISQQAEASRQFAESMNVLSKQISAAYAEIDLTKTQADWEIAVDKSGKLEDRMDHFLDSMQSDSASNPQASESGVSDAEIDRMIETDVLAQEQSELAKLNELESEIAKELVQAKQKD